MVYTRFGYITETIARSSTFAKAERPSPCSTIQWPLVCSDRYLPKTGLFVWIRLVNSPGSISGLTGCRRCKQIVWIRLLLVVVPCTCQRLAWSQTTMPARTMGMNSDFLGSRGWCQLDRCWRLHRESKTYDFFLNCFIRVGNEATSRDATASSCHTPSVAAAAECHDADFDPPHRLLWWSHLVP